MGLSVVTFDTPVSREILHDTGRYARFGSAADLADKLEQVLQTPHLAAHLGAAGRQRTLRDFSWTQAVQQIENIYAQVLHTPAEPIVSSTHTNGTAALEDLTATATMATADDAPVLVRERP